MRRGWKIYAAHHRIEMPVEMASLKCQPSSINQSSARNNNAAAMGPAFMGLTHGYRKQHLRGTPDTGEEKSRGEVLGLCPRVQVEHIQNTGGLSRQWHPLPCYESVWTVCCRNRKGEEGRKNEIMVSAPLTKQHCVIWHSQIM